MSTKKSVLGLVTTGEQASAIVTSLREAGFPAEDISMLVADEGGTRTISQEEKSKAPEGAVAGVGAGGALGVTLGLLAGLGAIAIPGLGPFIAAGPILAALSGAAVGATVGGVSGALIGFGIPEIEVKQYEGKLKGGHILISVHIESKEERDRARHLFEIHGATDIVIVGEHSLAA